MLGLEIGLGLGLQLRLQRDQDWSWIQGWHGVGAEVRLKIGGCDVVTSKQCPQCYGRDETNSHGLPSPVEEKGEHPDPCLDRLLLLFWAHYIEDGPHLLCTDSL